MENGFHCSTGDSCDAAICLHRRRTCDATMELAAAAALWLAPDHVLASAWTSCALQNPVRGIRKARLWTPQFSPSHERAMWKHDARGAGTISASYARTLGFRDFRWGDQAGMNCDPISLVFTIPAVCLPRLPKSGKRGAPSVVMMPTKSEPSLNENGQRLTHRRWQSRLRRSICPCKYR